MPADVLAIEEPLEVRLDSSTIYIDVERIRQAAAAPIPAPAPAGRIPLAVVSSKVLRE